MLYSLFWQLLSHGLAAVPRIASARTTTPDSPGPDGPDAPGPDTTQVTLFNPLKDETIPGLLSLILSTLTLLAIPVVAIMIVIGAYYIITSGGNPGRRATGKNYVLWAAVGFAILLLADSVVAILTDFISQ